MCDEIKISVFTWPGTYYTPPPTHTTATSRTTHKRQRRSDPAPRKKQVTNDRLQFLLGSGHYRWSEPGKDFMHFSEAKLREDLHALAKTDTQTIPTASGQPALTDEEVTSSEIFVQYLAWQRVQQIKATLQGTLLDHNAASSSSSSGLNSWVGKLKLVDLLNKVDLSSFSPIPKELAGGMRSQEEPDSTVVLALIIAKDTDIVLHSMRNPMCTIGRKIQNSEADVFENGDDEQDHSNASPHSPSHSPQNQRGPTTTHTTTTTTTTTTLNVAGTSSTSSSSKDSLGGLGGATLQEEDQSASNLGPPKSLTDLPLPTIGVSLDDDTTPAPYDNERPQNSEGTEAHAHSSGQEQRNASASPEHDQKQQKAKQRFPKPPSSRCDISLDSLQLLPQHMRDEVRYSKISHNHLKICYTPSTATFTCLNYSHNGTMATIPAGSMGGSKKDTVVFLHDDVLECPPGTILNIGGLKLVLALPMGGEDYVGAGVGEM